MPCFSSCDAKQFTFNVLFDSVAATGRERALMYFFEEQVYAKSLRRLYEECAESKVLSRLRAPHF